MERLQMGPVEKAIRNLVSAGDVLSTPTGRPFTVAGLGNKGPALLFGPKKTSTVIPWDALEGVPDFLGPEVWSVIGTVFAQEADPTTLDGYMKGFVSYRATSGWVACLLETAGVVLIDRHSPVRVRMRQDFCALEFDSDDGDNRQDKASAPRSPRLQEEAPVLDRDDNLWRAKGGNVKSNTSPTVMASELAPPFDAFHWLPALLNAQSDGVGRGHS
jgi:hypothetical protein